MIDKVMDAIGYTEMPCGVKLYGGFTERDIRVVAKAAIKAMREPFDRYAAHDTVVWSDGPDADITLTQLCEALPKNVQARIYRAMIDKALEGTK